MAHTRGFLYGTDEVCMPCLAFADCFSAQEARSGQLRASPARYLAGICKAYCVLCGCHNSTVSRISTEIQHKIVVESAWHPLLPRGMCTA